MLTERRKRERSKKSWRQGIRKAMNVKNLEDVQWNERQESRHRTAS